MFSRTTASVTMGSSYQMSPHSDDYSTLRDLLCRQSVRLGDFTLASGEKSSVYVDSKLTTYSPQAIALIGRLFLSKMHECGLSPDAVGGLDARRRPDRVFGRSGRVLIRATRFPAFVVRKEQKTHGMGRSIAGLENTRGVRVVIIDDVCTKGGSTGQAVEAAQQAGMEILGAICLVDRRQGATEYLWEKFGIRLESIFTLPDLVKHLERQREPAGAHS